MPNEYFDTNHTNKYFRQMYEFYNAGKFTDFELISADQIWWFEIFFEVKSILLNFHRRFKVHSIVLVTAGEYFHRIVLEGRKSHRLDSIDSATLGMVIIRTHTRQTRMEIAQRNSARDFCKQKHKTGWIEKLSTRPYNSWEWIPWRSLQLCNEADRKDCKWNQVIDAILQRNLSNDIPIICKYLSYIDWGFLPQP